MADLVASLTRVWGGMAATLATLQRGRGSCLCATLRRDCGGGKDGHWTVGEGWLRPPWSGGKESLCLEPGQVWPAACWAELAKQATHFLPLPPNNNISKLHSLNWGYPLKVSAFKYVHNQNLVTWSSDSETLTKFLLWLCLPDLNAKYLTHISCNESQPHSLNRIKSQCHW